MTEEKLKLLTAAVVHDSIPKLDDAIKEKFNQIFDNAYKENDELDVEFLAQSILYESIAFSTIMCGQVTVGILLKLGLITTEEN